MKQKLKTTVPITVCLLVTVSVSAQTTNPSQNAERERTRVRIAEITADEVRESDTSMSLGRRLNPAMLSEVWRLEDVAARGKNPYQPSARDHSLVMNNPYAFVEAPPPKRAVRRATPVLDISKKQIVFTPDFSRQVLSFSQLAGKDILDLPRAEDLSNTSSEAPPGKDSTTWGLSDILAEGLLVSPAQKQVLASFEIAQLQKKQAVADWYPSAAVRLTGGSTTTSPGDLSNGGYRSHTIRLTQPVINMPLIHNVASAERAQDAARLRQADSLEGIALSLTQATVNLAAARITINFADELETQLIKVLLYLETRTQAGATSQADLERARTRVAAAKQTRIDLQAAYKSSLFEVDRLIEQTPMSLRLPYLNQLPALPATQNEILELVRKNSHALMALEQDVKAQQRVVAAQKAKLIPTLGISLERDIQKNIGAEETPTNSFNRVLGVVSWQFSLGGKELFVADEAQAELRKRQSKLEEESRKLDQAVTSNFAALQSATLRISAAETEQRSAMAVADTVQTQLKLGRIGNILEALDASDRLFAARSRQIQALTQQFTSQSQLLRQIGLLRGMAAANVAVTGDAILKP